MHAVIEKARKAAGISGLTKNYPDDPKQRGCGYWASFLGSVSTQLGSLDEESKRSEREAKQLAIRISDLEHELAELRKRAGRNGVEALRLKEGWSIDKGEQVEKLLVGS